MEFKGKIDETILQVVWGYSSEVDTKTLDVYIYRLREKLGEPAASLIETISGIGYRFSNS